MRKSILFLSVFFLSILAYSQIQQTPQGTVYTNQEYTFSALCFSCQTPNWEVSPNHLFLIENNGFTVRTTFTTTGTRTILFKNGNTVLYQLVVNVVAGSGSNSGITPTIWARDANGIYYNSGNVGIGKNSTSSFKVDVGGSLRSTGIIRTDGGFEVDGNVVIDNNAGWHRSYGNTGWYNGTHGGGIYMQDNTWVRVYGNKSFYHNAGTMRTDGTFQVGQNGDRFYVDGSGNSALSGSFSTGGSITTSGNLRRTAHNTGHLEGSYNNVGPNSTNSNPIYTIGSNYNPSSTSLSNMYGIGYSHKNASFINNADLGTDPTHGWGAYVAADGNARIFFDASGGHGFFKGNLYNQNIYSRGTINASGGNSGEWNTAYTERGSQIAGTGLSWSGGKLNVSGASSPWQNNGSSINYDGYTSIGTLAPIAPLHVSTYEGSNNVTMDLTNAVTAVSLGLLIQGRDAWIETFANDDDGSWGSALNLSTANTAGLVDKWSFIRQTSNAGDGSLRLTYGNNPGPHINNTMMYFGTDGSVGLGGITSPTAGFMLDVAGALKVSGGNSNEWNTAYSERGSQIAGTGLNWSGGQLNVVNVNTDNQDLELSGNSLSLTNDATPVDLSGYLDNTDDQTATEVNFTSTSGLVSTDVNAAIDEINNRINSNDGSRWIETSGNIAFTSGQVTIGGLGTPKADYELSVAGEIVAEEVLIQFEGEWNWPDYVFSPSYELLPIIDLKEYIEENKHLPNVPSAAEINENGIEVGEMNKILLEKIEELTLYMIQQSDQIKAQSKELESLKEKVAELENKQ